MLKYKNNERVIKQIVDLLFYHLQDYVAHANQRSVEDKLYEIFKSEDIVVISKAEFARLTAIEETVLKMGTLSATPIVINKE